MKLPVNLQELLAQNPEAIAPVKALIAQEMVIIDATGINSLDIEQLEQILDNISKTWDFNRLKTLFNADTLNESLERQLTEWCERRQGKQTQPKLILKDKAEEKKALDIFKLRDEVIGDYRTYIESFLEIRDRRVADFVQQELDKGYLWSDPLVQINPAYKQGAAVDELINEGVLHSDCKQYFPDFRFYYHQEQAFRCAKRDEPYVLTTGTGSGKSLSYVVPIIDDLLRNPQLKGIRAILVYPMNALINSQEEEFKKFLAKYKEASGKDSHIRVARYTGQENLSQKSDIQNNPPHILLTNYVMLELMLSSRSRRKIC